MGKPDYADILSRSLDLLDRKYDFTPEGRSESQKLALELELMNPSSCEAGERLLRPNRRPHASLPRRRPTKLGRRFRTPSA